MIEKKGQVGRILTSFPALIIIFFIMLIFVLLSIFVFGLGGSKSGSQILSPQGFDKTNSKVLLDIFLKQKIKAAEWNDASFTSGEISINSLINVMIKQKGAEQENTIKVVQNKFHQVCSGDKKNVLKVLFLKKVVNGYEVTEYINYPETFDNFVFPPKSGGFLATGSYNESCNVLGNSYSNGFWKTSGMVGNNLICVYVEDVTEC